MNLGSGENGQFTFLDTIGLMSFFIAMMNLNENLGQGDKQELLETFSRNADRLLGEIHDHLERQDQKIDLILKEISHDNK